ncbi:MAG: hypothetical protein ACREDR_00990 [Blastocatellia bacterium]
MIHDTKTNPANSTTQVQAVSATQISREQLQEHWLHLRIKKRTLLYLQQVLDRQEASLHTQLDAGVAMALVATRARASEKRGKSILAEGEDFFVEELRMTFLEGLSQHCVETLRVVLGTFAALQIRFLPSLLSWPSTTWLFTCIVLALIGLLVYVGLIAVRTHWQTQRATPPGVSIASRFHLTSIHHARG